MLTNEDCISVLKNYLGEDNVINFKKFETKPISKDIEGFLGEHYHLLITYETNGQEQTNSFFLKTKPTKNKLQEETVEKLYVYKKETFMYNFLFKEFQKYGYDISFAPEIFYYVENSAIVMENLNEKEYTITDRHSYLSMDHLKCALKKLALFHGAGFAYERMRASELGKNYCLGTEHKEEMVEPLYVQYIDPNGYSMNFWKCFKNTFSALISLLPSDQFDREHFQKMFDNFDTGKVFVEQTNISKTCGHGDMWSNNMLFKYEDSKVVDCKLIDFQIARYFYPCFDVILIIFCNTDVGFRAKYLEELYKYYHEALANTLRNYGFDVDQVHSWEDFLKSIKMVSADALSHVILAKSMVNLPKEKLSNMVNESKQDYEEAMFDNTKMISDAFQTSNRYREIMIECMNDFYKALLSKQ